MPNLETHLVLNRYCHAVLGAAEFASLKNLLRPLPEGPDGSGQSHYFARLATQPGLRVPVERLAHYDRQVMGYAARLRQARHDFQGFRYFQHLALLYSELFLDRLTADPVSFAADLNAFAAELRQHDSALRDFPAFTPASLRRLAFFMATGSGKTLLLHVNLWQVLHYLQHGAHPEALAPGSAPRREFANLLLITPNEGLSTQHLAELRTSGIDACRFVENPHGRGGVFGPLVKVIEIHKLAESATRDGVSVVLEEIGGDNLVIVDEGHKGTGSEAQVWKNRQKALSERGFLLEYSATFAQAIAAAGKKAQPELLREYGQAILFDYSYAHFYGDGYGKDFTVLNLQDQRPDKAHELLVGGLLAFYHQRRLYAQHAAAYRPFNIEAPLWVLLGSSVNALYTEQKQRRSDVAEVVAFIKHFVEDRTWAVATIAAIVQGASGFQDAASGQDLFAPHIEHLRGQDAGALYAAIRTDLFHGSGGLEVWELQQTEGELGLRLSTAADPAAPYFGVINIGDAAAFKKYLAEHLQIEVQTDNFRPSQFKIVDAPDSPITLLIGARKFIEGWSSWRVASMGLLNVGQGAGSQIIQLFGRGVRLKGKGMSLKRCSALDEAELGGIVAPDGIRFLETLTIFGWNANYIQTFRQIIDAEDVGREFVLPVRKMTPWPAGRLPLPQTPPGFDAGHLVWSLDASGPLVELDLTARLSGFTSTSAAPQMQHGAAANTLTVDFREDRFLAALDAEKVYLDVLRYKTARGYHNLHLTPASVRQVLTECCRLRMTEDALTLESLQRAAGQAVCTYLDRFVRVQERSAESHRAAPAYLAADDLRVQDAYRIRVKQGPLLAQIEQLLHQPPPPHDAGEPLPRLYLDRSLFTPLLAEGGQAWHEQVAVQPPALNRDEKNFVNAVRSFWLAQHTQPAWVTCGLYLLRNTARTGIGLFHRSGFYPDFILWIVDEAKALTHVLFVDPHGLHHGGLAGNADKFAALAALHALSDQDDFREQRIRLDGRLLTTTPVAQIPDAGGHTQAELEAVYPLIFQEGSYVARLLAKCASD